MTLIPEDDLGSGASGVAEGQEKAEFRRQKPFMCGSDTHRHENRRDAGRTVADRRPQETRCVIGHTRW